MATLPVSLTTILYIYNMTEKFTHKGQWFLPEEPQNRIHGTLIYDPGEGSTLELFGNFNNDLYSGMASISLILGLTSDSKEVTLYNCFLTKSSGPVLKSSGEVGIAHSFYTVNFILENAHIRSLSELKFEAIEAEIGNL